MLFLVSETCTCFLLVNAFEDKAGVLGGVSQGENILVNLFEGFLIDNAVGAFLFECSVEKLHLGSCELGLLRQKRLCNNLNFVCFAKDLECSFNGFAQNGGLICGANLNLAQ